MPKGYGGGHIREDIMEARLGRPTCLTGVGSGDNMDAMLEGKNTVYQYLCRAG